MQQHLEHCTITPCKPWGAFWLKPLTSLARPSRPLLSQCVQADGSCACAHRAGPKLLGCCLGRCLRAWSHLGATYCTSFAHVGGVCVLTFVEVRLRHTGGVGRAFLTVGQESTGWVHTCILPASLPLRACMIHRGAHQRHAWWHAGLASAFLIQSSSRKLQQSAFRRCMWWPHSCGAAAV